MDDDEEEGEVAEYRTRVSLAEQASICRRLRFHEKRLAPAKLTPTIQRAMVHGHVGANSLRGFEY